MTGSAPVSGSTGTLAGLQVPGEGEWDLSLRLQDAAGNTASGNVARTTVRYDATAPVASPNLAVSSIRKDTEQELVAYFNPPSGQQAPVTEALWSLCRQGSTTGCSAGTLTADPSSTNTLRTAVPAHGDWTLSVRLRDQAGNVGPPATTTLRYVAAPTPAPTSTPAPSPTATPSPSSPAKPAPRRRAGLRVGSAVLDRSRRTLTVKGTTAAGAAGRVRLMITATRNGRTRTSSRVTAIRRGRFVARLSLSRGDARARLRISAVYDGSSTHLPDRAPRRLVRVR